VYLAEEAAEETAERFLRRVEESLQMLARHPEIGVALSLRPQQLAGLRKWQVQDFPSFLIFYRPRRDGISVVRVLHAAQDWWGLLGIISPTS
jgi:toxin ParE1/3/4